MTGRQTQASPLTLINIGRSLDIQENQDSATLSLALLSFLMLFVELT